MNKRILSLIERGLEKKISGTGLGVFRICFGLVIIQEIIFLYYFRHLIFDDIPYIDSATPHIDIALISWAIVSIMLTIGFHTRLNAILNYLFWVAFLIFTPMWHDFDGGFDQLMTSSSFLLIFLPAGNNISIDSLRLKLNGTIQHTLLTTNKVPVLSYYAPLAISLGLLYFDAALHKLFSEFWRNGLGTWLPSTMPYYISALDMGWLLNIKWLQMTFGYSLILFQFCFVFLCYFKKFRIPLLIIGIIFHIGIILSLNIYPFGFGMLVHYTLLVPISWWPRIKKAISVRSNRTNLYFDPQSPPAWRFAIIVKHFDILNSFDLHPIEHKKHEPEQSRFCADTLYILDDKGIKRRDSQALISILYQMRYTAPIGLLFRFPIFNFLIRKIYDKSEANKRISSKSTSLVHSNKRYAEEDSLAQTDTFNPNNLHRQAQSLYRFFGVILLLQLNCTIYYGLIYRLNIDTRVTALTRAITDVSNITTSLSHTLLGITPHALYMDEHFSGYNRILALTYLSDDGQERWLPFVNQQGRFIAPNWGRVHSMWANVAVRPIFEKDRLYKFVRKVTAFWAPKMGVSTNHSKFLIKMKRICVPMTWRHNLQKQNLSGQWKTIGSVIWKNNRMQIDIPNTYFSENNVYRC